MVYHRPNSGMIRIYKNHLRGRFAVEIINETVSRYETEAIFCNYETVLLGTVLFCPKSTAVSGISLRTV